jgi:hypothetical protein
MAKFIMKNGSFWISSATAPTAVAVTAATKGSTTQLTVTNTAAVGDIVIVTGSGWPSLDGKPGRVTVASGTAVTVAVDTAAETAAFSTAKGKAQFWAAANWIEFCLSGLDIDSGTADSIAVGTFCDAGAALAGASSNGTVNLTGFIDITDPGYQALLAASADGVPRNFKLVLPKAANSSAADANGGVFYFLNATVGAVSQSYQVGQAASFTSSLVLSAKPVFVPAV